MTAAEVLSFGPLDSGLRRGLEGVVVEARGLVEAGVGKVFGRLGVERSGVSDRVPEHLSDGERRLRAAVLAKRRQAGSVDAAVEEVAFGVWHRMLFARFLAENDLLMHPEAEVAVSLGEVAELAAEEGVDSWVLASRFAAVMLPGLFSQDDPLSQIELLPEDLHALETLLEGLPVEVFTSDDGLGWVYQFWQSKRKDEVNASETKIGARELPAVTQLFTEHYMVRFLLENSLGAWWAARHPDSPLTDTFEYLRFTDGGEPAAGSFEGWPDRVAEVTVMDPCCGSGHFVVAAFEMLWRMRAEEEGLSPVKAQDAVISENLFGLELDPRCTQIAAFNLALAAWKAGGYRQLPLPNIACSGIRVAGSLDEWLKLAGDDERLRAGLEALHSQFKDADVLGSLINPRRASEDGTLTAVDWDELEPLLHQALSKEKTTDPAAAVFGQQAEATAKAATLLANTYTLITTNPPFLSRNFHSDKLLGALEARFENSKADLATVCLERATQMTRTCVSVVNPQGWLYLSRQESFRRQSLEKWSWLMIARLGPRAFTSISGEIVNVFLGIWTIDTPSDEHEFAELSVEDATNPELKAIGLPQTPISTSNQSALLGLDGLVVTTLAVGQPLAKEADSHQGIKTGDNGRFLREMTELPEISGGWVRLQSSPDETVPYGGRSSIAYWQDGHGQMATVTQQGATFRGQSAWGRQGVVVGSMNLAATLYNGEIFDGRGTVITTRQGRNSTALWCFVTSDQLRRSLTQLDRGLSIATSTFVKVPFDVEFWRGVAEERFPDGLPEPWSDDPTQWLFLGDPAVSTDPLQVAVARLLGYSWPDQEADQLDRFADDDGIVCLPAVGGERPAAERLRELMVEAFKPDDPTALIDGLLADTDTEGKSLEWWLRERFFKQHCKLFGNRPFIWHVWDGRTDGFSALVNYHRLDTAKLKKLTYSYLGWWIERQQAQVRDEKPGAEARLAAALELQHKLELILEGEPPYDIFVRWKELHEQPIGWEPDLNDGVRLNVRPFVEAGVLRNKVNVDWKKDRGKNPDGTERFNDRHYTRTEKHTARQTHQEGAS